MAEYIDRQAAIDSLLGWAAQLTETYGKNDEYVRCLESAAYNIEQIHAADVWEVVHCADCAHAEESLVSGCVYCNEMERARIKEGFCAWGERKTKHGLHQQSACCDSI